ADVVVLRVPPLVFAQEREVKRMSELVRNDHRLALRSMKIRYAEQPVFSRLVLDVHQRVAVEQALRFHERYRGMAMVWRIVRELIRVGEVDPLRLITRRAQGRCAAEWKVGLGQAAEKTQRLEGHFVRDLRAVENVVPVALAVWKADIHPASIVDM